MSSRGDWEASCSTESPDLLHVLRLSLSVSPSLSLILFNFYQEDRLLRRSSAELEVRLSQKTRTSRKHATGKQFPKKENEEAAVKVAFKYARRRTTDGCF